jgi:hypothetical protein
MWRLVQVIRIIDTPLIIQFKKKYTEFYCDTRKEHIPIEYTFLATKMKFQDFIIKEMDLCPNKSHEIVKAYKHIKEDKTLQEKAIKVYQARTKRVLYG